MISTEIIINLIIKTIILVPCIFLSRSGKLRKCSGNGWCLIYGFCSLLISNDVWFIPRGLL